MSGARNGTIHVLDGTAALFRAHFGMNSVTAPDGLEVGALLGLGQWITRFLREVNPSHVGVVFDSPERTFRHGIYPQYKANRSEPPPALVPQFPLALELVAALGLPGFRVPGFEADDLMATMARRGRTAGVEVVMVTPDKDVLQLVGEGVWVMDPRTFARLGPEAARSRFGVPPEQVADLQALAGDSTDNIPGVLGIGPKAAQALIAAFGTLEAVFADVDRAATLGIRGAKSLPQRLRTGRDDAFLCRKLVTLHDDVPLRDEAMNLGTLRWRGPSAGADAFFDRVGFHQPLRSLRDASRETSVRCQARD